MRVIFFRGYLICRSWYRIVRDAARSNKHSLKYKKQGRVSFHALVNSSFIYRDLKALLSSYLFLLTVLILQLNVCCNSEAAIKNDARDVSKSRRFEREKDWEKNEEKRFTILARRLKRHRRFNLWIRPKVHPCFTDLLSQPFREKRRRDASSRFA